MVKKAHHLFVKPEDDSFKFLALSDKNPKILSLPSYETEKQQILTAEKL